MHVRRVLAGAGVSVGAVLAMAIPASAHHCYNPNKPAGAGVNYTIVGFGPEGPIFEQTGPGQGIGGFATLDGVDIHTIGNSGAITTVGGPGSTGDHATDGKGIDLL